MTDLGIAAVMLLAAVALAWAAHEFLYRLAPRFLSDIFWRSLVQRTRAPTRFALSIIVLSLAVNVAPLSRSEIAIVRHLLLIGFVICAAWLARTALSIWMTLHLRRFKLDTEDNLLARKHVTQTHILQRVADTLIVVIGVSAVLMTFSGVRQYGVSLLASAGAAGIVVGLALQPLLRNLFAGIQLALTQPIRIDDAVIVENEFGKVEEITSTYVVLRLWDKRRMIVPLNHFIEQTFQNWTRQDAALIGTVFIYLDYSTPLAALRAEVERIVRASPNWDGKTVAVQITDFRESVMEVRVLASARNSGAAFDLRCQIREQIADFLQENYPGSLPRLRAEVAEPPERRQAAPRQAR